MTCQVGDLTIMPKPQTSSLGHLNHNISSLGEALYVKQQNPSINEIDLVQLGSHPEPFGNKLKR